MNPIKSHYIRWLINHKDYYKSRAIEMGELYGAWYAKYNLAMLGQKQDFFTMKQSALKADIYYHRMMWYASRAKQTTNAPDYNT